MTPTSDKFPWRSLACCVVAAVALVVGCNHTGTHTAPTGEGLAKVAAQNATIAELGQQAIPHADAEGKAVLHAQAKVVDDQALTITLTQKEFADSEREKERLTADSAKKDQRIAKIESGWGFKLQSLVEWAWFWVKIGLAVLAAAAVFHVVGGLIGAAFIATPLGAEVAWLAKIINPLGLISVAIQKAETAFHLSSAVAAAAVTATPTKG